MNLAMRRWSANDAARLVEIYGASDDLARQVGELETLVEAEALIATYDSMTRTGSGSVWAITLGGSPIGSVGITSINRRHQTGWCWYWVDSQHGATASLPGHWRRPQITASPTTSSGSNLPTE